jgi:hypothetical protein
MRSSAEQRVSAQFQRCIGDATVAITLDLYSDASPSMHRPRCADLDALLRAPEGVNAGVKSPSHTAESNTDGWCRGRDSNPYKVALTSPSS